MAFLIDIIMPPVALSPMAQVPGLRQSPFSASTMGIANCYRASADSLEKVETALNQNIPDRTAAKRDLEALKQQFEREAASPGEMHPVNLVKRARRVTEYKGYSKKVDEILRLI